MVFFLGSTRALSSNKILKNKIQKKKKKQLLHWKGKMLLSSSEADKFLVCAAACVKRTKLHNVRKTKDSTGYV